MYICIADCCSLETIGEKDGVVEVNAIDGTIIRCWNGNAYIRSDSIFLMVPIRLDIPDKVDVQPSFQQRFGNFTYPRW